MPVRTPIAGMRPTSRHLPPPTPATQADKTVRWSASKIAPVRPTIKGGLPPSLHQAVLRGRQCCARVPERIVSEETARRYEATFIRMWEPGNLSPLSSGIAYNTFYERRAALHYGAVKVIRKLIDRALGAFERQDYPAVTDP